MRVQNNKRRKIMKKLSLIIIILIAVTTSGAYAAKFKPGSEPTGFRKIKWGTPSHNIKGVTLYPEYSKGLGFCIAKLSNVYCKSIGNQKIKGITYYFVKDKFVGVNIYFDKSASYYDLRNIFKYKYGESTNIADRIIMDSFVFQDKRMWEGRKSTVILANNTDFQGKYSCGIEILYTPFYKMREKNRKKRRQEEEKEIEKEYQNSLKKAANDF